MPEVFCSPVYNVIAVPLKKIRANSYNPNSVAPPEMELLEVSIWEDGFTQPVVCYYILSEDIYEIVDGYHRYTTLLTSERIRKREKDHCPVVVINKDESNRMASTIRHNRARGTHSIELMSNIVAELTRSGMSDAWILRHIGMDKDELLRLKQITGIADLFADKEFSEAWAGSDELPPVSIYPIEHKARVKAIATAILEQLGVTPVGLFSLLKRLQLPVDDKAIVLALLTKFKEKGKVTTVRTSAGKRRYKLKESR